MSSTISINKFHQVHSSNDQTALDKKIKDASQAYEDYFLNEMVKAMRKTVPTGEGMIPTNFAQGIYEQQLDQEYVNKWSDSGGIGLSKIIYEQIREKLGLDNSLPQPQGPISIDKKNELLPLKNEVFENNNEGQNIKKTSSFIFKKNINGNMDKTEVTSPWSGKIVENFINPEGFVTWIIDHGNGLESNLNYKGIGLQLGVGSEVKMGDLLGHVSSFESSLNWKVTKSG